MVTRIFGASGFRNLALYLEDAQFTPIPEITKE